MPTQIIASAMLLTAALPLCGVRASAQQTQSEIAITGGVATDQRGVHSGAVTVAPSLLLAPGTNASLALGANATRFTTDAWSLGGTGALALRSPLGQFVALTLNAATTVSWLAGSANGSFVIGALVPALELRAGPLTIYGGGQAGIGRTSQPGIAPSPTPIVGRGNAASVVTTASGAGSVFGALLRISPADAVQPSLEIGSRADRMTIGGNVITDRAVTVAGRHADATLAVSAGRRSASDENAAFAALAASLPIARDLSLQVAAGRYPGNRLLGTPAGRYASAGVSVRFGAGRAVSLANARGAPAPGRGSTRLTIRAPAAQRVEVAGDFTEWKFVEAKRASNGVWYADLRIPAGQYRYAFRINGTEWRVPDGATAVDDGFGGKSAWITIPADERSR